MAVLSDVISPLDGQHALISSPERFQYRPIDRYQKVFPSVLTTDFVGSLPAVPSLFEKNTRRSTDEQCHCPTMSRLWIKKESPRFRQAAMVEDSIRIFRSKPT